LNTLPTIDPSKKNKRRNIYEPIGIDSFMKFKARQVVKDTLFLGLERTTLRPQKDTKVSTADWIYQSRGTF